MSYENAKLALVGSRFSDLRHVEETGSTNADLRSLLADPGGTGAVVEPGESVVLVADYQSAGRGRSNRVWQAPPGASILMTIALPLGPVPVERHTLLTMALSLAVSDALIARGIESLSLKWPNDLVLDDPESRAPGEGGGESGRSDIRAAGREGQARQNPLGYRKACGILAERVDSGRGEPYALIGMGLNVNWNQPSSGASAEIDADGVEQVGANDGAGGSETLVNVAVSLDELLGQPLDRWDLIVGILQSFDEEWLPVLESGQVSRLLAVYRKRCSTLRRRVRVVLPDGEITGIATDVDITGALIVDDGESTRLITAGDVVHVRPI